MSKALFLLPARSCLLFYVISKEEKMVLDRCSTIPSLFPLIYFLEEIWDDMACDSAFLFSHSLGIMISLMIFAIVLFF